MIPSEGKLAGRSILVTGAASGMGRSTAVRAAEEGAAVSLVDVDTGGLDETARRVDEVGGDAVVCPGDVRRERDVGAAVDATVSGFGRLDGVVTAAGIFHAGDLAPVAAVTLDDFEHVLAVNLVGTFLVVKLALPHLVRDGGAVVTIASTAALRGHGQGPGYTASKGGVTALTRLVATQYGPEGLRANCICPGAVDTPMTAGSFVTPEAERGLRRTVPLGRVGQPEDIAALAVYLLSDDAAYVTGQTLAADGGATIKG